jgi:hypothetical protein
LLEFGIPCKDIPKTVQVLVTSLSFNFIYCFTFLLADHLSFLFNVIKIIKTCWVSEGPFWPKINIYTVMLHGRISNSFSRFMTEKMTKISCKRWRTPVLLFLEINTHKISLILFFFFCPGPIDLFKFYNIMWPMYRSWWASGGFSKNIFFLFFCRLNHNNNASHLRTIWMSPNANQSKLSSYHPDFLVNWRGKEKTLEAYEVIWHYV